MKNPRGYYDVFIKTCAKYPTNVAVRQYEQNSHSYKMYTYSELYGVCEYIAQNLQLLRCTKGMIGLVTDSNVIVPCLVAACHKSNTTFMFLNSTQDIEHQANNVSFKVIITVSKDNDTHQKNPLGKPDKTVSVLEYIISFYNLQHCVQSPKCFEGRSFIMKTSGSSGEPKQIEVPISCIQPNINDLTKLFNIRSEDVIYLSTPLTFDPSMIEIQLALMNGASLLIAPDNLELIFPENKYSSVTVWQTTPSKFFQHTDEEISDVILSANSSLRILALGGEPIRGVKRLSALKDKNNLTKIFTLYGVTEMSCWAAIAELDLDKIRNDRDIPLGNCLSETEIIIKNKKKSYTGKILLFSTTRKCEVLNVARESKDKAQKTNSNKSSNLVCTGDLGERKNGVIYYRGRTDSIIKRFGHKVNLHLIEDTVMQCAKIKCCSCVWLPKPMLLVVYFSSDKHSSKEVSDYLRCTLDEKHWPDKVVRVDAIPMNRHGKISKRLLSKEYENHPTTPQSILSFKLIFLEELKVVLDGDFTYDSVKDKDFFSLGGTSFMAVTLCNRLSQINCTLGRYVLPYLLTPKNTIDNIMKKAKEAHTLDTKSSMKKLRFSSEIQSSLSSEQSLIFTRKDSVVSPIEFCVKWSYNTGKCVDCSPTLLRTWNTLYVAVGSHSGQIVIYDAMYGMVTGVVKVKSRFEASVLCYYELPMMVPCGVVGGYNGKVVCFKLENGRQKWCVNIGSMVKSKAVQYHHYIYVAAYDGNIHYLNMNTGQQKGVIPISDQPISADLVLASDLYILVGTLSGVCASIQAENNSILWRQTLASPIFAKPVLYNDDKYVVFAEVNGDIHCFAVNTGNKIWQFQGAKGNLFSSMYVKKLDKMLWQMVFGCHDSKVYSIIIKDAQPSLHWRTQVESPVYSTPCGLTDGLVLAAAKIGMLYVIQTATGDIISEYKLPSETFSSPCVHDDNIFIGCRDDYIYSLKFVSNLTGATSKTYVL